MKSNNLTKEDIKKIVKDEIKNFIQREFDTEIQKILSKSTGKSRKEMVKLVKDGVAKLAEFLWVRKSVWQNDIR